MTVLALLLVFAMTSGGWIVIEARVSSRVRAALEAEASGGPAVAVQPIQRLNYAGTVTGAIATASILGALAVADEALIEQYGTFWFIVGGVLGASVIGLSALWGATLRTMAARR